MRWLIWSHRKRQWWKANREGYTSDLREAGYYGIDDVGDIITSGLPGQQVPVDATLAENRFVGSSADEVIAEIDSFRNY